MQTSTAPCLTTSALTATISALCLALCLGTPMDRADLPGSLHAPDSAFIPLLRTARSSVEDVPCVYVPYLSALKQRFIRWLDNNNDGKATFQEVKDYLQKFKANVKDEVVEAFIRRRDQDGNGAIDFVPEYVHDMTAADNTLEGATELFHLQDTNEDGVVDEKEIMHVSQALGSSTQEAEEMTLGYYMMADANKDGKLTFGEFKTLYNQ